jgi:hypothetical protein
MESKRAVVKILYHLPLSTVEEQTISCMNSEDPHPDPDPLVRGIDPRNRIRIRPKISWIRNTEKNITSGLMGLAAC